LLLYFKPSFVDIKYWRHLVTEELMADELHSDVYIQTWARIYGWSPERVIDEIESIDLLDSKFIQWCRSVKAELAPDLMEIMHEQQGEASLRASLLLLCLGEPDGTDGIITCLQEADPHFRISVFSRISTLPLSPGDFRAPVPLKKEGLYAALDPLLETPGEGEPSDRQRVHNLAIGIALKLDLPEAYERLLPMLESGPTQIRVKLLSHLARRGEDRGGLDTAKELLAADSEIYWVISALERYSKGDDPVLAQQASQLLVDFVRENTDRAGNDVTNLLSRALDGIVAAHHPEREQVLKQVLNGPVEDWRRGIALRHLAALEGEAGYPRLSTALADPELRSYAAQAISANPPSDGNAKLEQALLTAARQERNRRALSRLLDALVAVGAEMKDIPEDVRGRLEPDAAMRVHWLGHGITARGAAELFVEAGIIPTPTEEQLQELDARWEQERSAHGAVISLLEKRMAWFATETGFVPPDYLDLLSQLVSISHPVFQTTALSQTVDEESGESEICFVYNDKEYAFTVRNVGDYYDVPSVLAGLNQALAEGEREERFLPLYTGDQTAAVVFVPEEPFLEISEILHIPLEEDQEAARKRGEAFEKRVLEEIRRQLERDEGRQRRPSLIQRLLAWFSGRNGQEE
jgi:hypothetical protein